ncbi:histidine phosphatase family protein [Aestuariirhabdus sp. LZHN29]|uniref:histidine phosphatase family protein n=1 Tax=Aestuariirhabdus sp. LZHN29 TaxID=3417462 RepID=UPI003CF3886A
MIHIYMLRHGTTLWNQQKRIQGHTDIPLLPESIRVLSGLVLAAPFRDLQWYCSPLTRAQQTAQALGLKPILSAGLVEMEWGEWEGRTISELRSESPALMANEEGRGRFMTPPGGECPQQVVDRLMQWLDELQPGCDIGLVTHKGVIRAAMAEACQWDMLGRSPVKPDWGKLLQFSWSSGAGLRFCGCDLSLEKDLIPGGK